MAGSSVTPSSFRLADIRCPFPLTYHKNGDEIAAASDRWFETGCQYFTEDRRRRLHGLKAGRLAAYCYNRADDSRLRVICDFINLLFHLDDLCDDMKALDTVILSDIVMNALASPHSYQRTLPDGRELPEEEPEASKLTRDFWGRCTQDARPGVQARYCTNVDKFFKAVESEALSRESGSPPDVETYMNIRRDNGCVYACFDLLEYALGIDLPDFVSDDPVLKTLAQCANDFIALSNDIFSYNVEQFRGDVFNIVIVLMKTYDLELQAAIDRAGEMCGATLDMYSENKTKLPSWGPQIDKDVAAYVQGFEDWVTGTFHWSFMSERYFGPNHEQVQPNGVVELLIPGERIQSSVNPTSANI